MNLYLVQHGKAKSKEEDPARPLSEIGVAEVTRMARFVSGNCSLQAGKIYHSGKLRARQTADILARELSRGEPQKMDGLAPMDDPRIWANRLRETEEDIMLVGHLPHMARLTAMLLGEGLEGVVVKFQMGCILSLERVESVWSVQWMIVPEILPGV